jgi:hypothetical protein
MASMIMERVWTIVLLGLATAAPEPPSIGVFVKSGPQVRELPDSERKAREKALSARYKDEYKAWEQLAKDFRKQFGKNVDKWPEEQLRAMRAAEERVYATDAEITFLKADPNYADSVADLRAHIGASKRLYVVEKVEEAHLVVEVLARKGSIGPGARNRLLCRISLGAKAKARRPRPEWDKVVWPRRRSLTNDGETYVLHSYTSKEPWWSIHEADFSRWTAVPRWIAYGLEDFAKQNAEALTGVPTPKR